MVDMRNWTDGQFEEAGFDDDQIEEIREGLQAGLTDGQMAMYAKPGYSSFIMRQIRSGLEHGLIPEQVAVYARPEYNTLQMQEIRSGLEHGLTPYQISAYAHPELRWTVMYEAARGIEHGLTPEQVAVYARPGISGLQAQEIRLGLEHGLVPEQIAIYAQSSMEWWQMREVRRAIEDGLPGDQAAVLAQPNIARFGITKVASILRATGDISQAEEYLASAEYIESQKVDMALAVLVKPGEAPIVVEYPANQRGYAETASKYLGANAVEMTLIPGYKLLVPSARTLETNVPNRALFASKFMETAGYTKILHDTSEFPASEFDKAIHDGELYTIAYGNILIIGDGSNRIGNTPTLTPEQAIAAKKEYSNPETGPIVETALTNGIKPSDINASNINEWIKAVNASNLFIEQPHETAVEPQTSPLINWAAAARETIENYESQANMDRTKQTNAQVR